MPISLILTCTVFTGSCPQVHRSNTETRIADYLQSIEFYLKTTNLDLIIVENSGFDLDIWKNIFIDYEPRLEFLSMDYNSGSGVGKGNGEKDSILYCIDNSIKLQNYEHFYKVSGRYKSPDIENIINNNDDFDVVSRHIQSDGNVLTVFFGCKKNNFKEFFSNDLILSDNGSIFENRLASMINELSSRGGYNIVFIPAMTYIDTICSNGVPFTLG